VRLLLLPLGAALLVTPFVFDANLAGTLASVLCGTALMALALPRGQFRARYGSWQQHIERL
jgi:hypothetical protein